MHDGSAERSKSHAPTMKLYDDPEQRSIDLEDTRIGPGRDRRVRASRILGKAGKIPRCRLRSSAVICAISATLFDKYKYDCALYGHFGQGCIHTRIDFDFKTKDGIKKFRSFIREAADLVVRYGGSLSGEHGDGQSRANFCRRCSAMNWSRRSASSKRSGIRDWKMNPHKIVDPYRVDENLRLGADYNPPDDRDAFSVSRRSGKLRPGDPALRRGRRVPPRAGGTMCPSYRVTREEMHSTRGRARLLLEMLEGDPLKDGWRRKPSRCAASLPGLQRLQRRLSGQRRHGDVQGRVSFALLCRPSAAACTPIRWV